MVTAAGPGLEDGRRTQPGRRVGQSRAGSVVEAVVNVIVGYGVAVVTQIVVFPCFGWNPDPFTNVKIASIFTCVSLIRSYLLRRVFNYLHVGSGR